MPTPTPCPRCLGPTTPSGTCAPCEREIMVASGAYALEDSLFRTAARLFGTVLDDVELILERPHGLWKVSLRLVPDARPLLVSAPCASRLDALKDLAAALRATGREVA